MRISDWTSDVCSSDLLYARLTPWQRTQVARHPERPHFKDYAAALIADFTPLAGDRNFGEDAAITGGLGRFRGRPVVVMGHEKGNDTTSRLRHNRSEEHTSELQSLMRNSYAVFCLKKKK